MGIFQQGNYFFRQVAGKKKKIIQWTQYILDISRVTRAFSRLNWAPEPTDEWPFCPLETFALKINLHLFSELQAAIHRRTNMPCGTVKKKKFQNPIRTPNLASPFACSGHLKYHCLQPSWQKESFSGHRLHSVWEQPMAKATQHSRSSPPSEQFDNRITSISTTENLLFFRKLICSVLKPTFFSSFIIKWSSSTNMVEKQA